MTHPRVSLAFSAPSVRAVAAVPLLVPEATTAHVEPSLIVGVVGHAVADLRGPAPPMVENKSARRNVTA